MDSQNKSRAKSTAAITCIKLLLHIFNFIYMIIGICVLAIGIWTQIELKSYMELTQLYYDNAAYIMIGVGVLILLVAIGGFYCTAKDKIGPLYLYAIFISLLAIVQVAAGIAGGAFAHQLDDKLTTGLTNSIKDHSDNMKAWNTVQQKFGCCGSSAPEDWMKDGHLATYPNSCYKDDKAHPVTAPSNTTATVPTTLPVTTTNATVTTPNATVPSNASSTVADTLTTAPNNTENDTTTGALPPVSTVKPSSGSRKRREANTNADGLYTDGCHQKLSDTVHQYLAAIVGVCIGFVVLQVLGAVLACCLAKKTSKNNYEQIY